MKTTHFVRTIVLVGSLLGLKAFPLLMTLALVAMTDPRPTHAQTAVEAWVQRYNGSTASDDQVAKLVLDSAGDVIVAGSGNAQVTGFDWVIIKYSGAGLPLWTNRYNGPANRDDAPVDVATDMNGNVFVTGSSFGNADSDYVTIAYSSVGFPLWTNRFGYSSNSHDYPTALAVGGGGNVFVTGASFPTGISDYATIKYSGAGVPLWTNIYNGAGDFADTPNAVARWTAAATCSSRALPTWGRVF